MDGITSAWLHAKMLILQPRLIATEKSHVYTFTHSEESPPLAVVWRPPASTEST